MVQKQKQQNSETLERGAHVKLKRNRVLKLTINPVAAGLNLMDAAQFEPI